MISGTHLDLTIERTRPASPARALFCLITLCNGKTSDPHSSKSFPIYSDLTFIYNQTPNSPLSLLDCLERKKQSQVHVYFSPPKGPQGEFTWGCTTHRHTSDMQSSTNTGNPQHRAFTGEERVKKVVLPLVDIKMNTICLRSLSLTKLSSDHHVTRRWNSKQ